MTMVEQTASEDGETVAALRAEVAELREAVRSLEDFCQQQAEVMEAQATLVYAWRQKIPTG